MLSNTASQSNVSGSASSVLLLAANTARKGIIIFNDSSADLYISIGTTASATNFAVKLGAAGKYETVVFVPSQNIYGIWGSATGAARITEFT